VSNPLGRNAPRRNCAVCGTRTTGLLLCGACGKSYDRARAADVTVYGAIEWATKRARRFKPNCDNCMAEARERLLRAVFNEDKKP
jgi:hypothetical protein